MDALQKVLRLPAVHSKRFLTSKVDRCVTGTAQYVSCALAFEQSTALAFEQTTALAFEQSTVLAFGKTTALAFEQSTALAFGEAVHMCRSCHDAAMWMCHFVSFIAL